MWVTGVQTCALPIYDCADAVVRFFSGYDVNVLATSETETETVDEEEDGGEDQEAVLEEERKLQKTTTIDG